MYGQHNVKQSERQMTGNPAFGDFDADPQVILSQKESELEDLMNEVDAKQVDVDGMLSSIVSKQAEIQKLKRKRDIRQKAAQFRSREVEGLANSVCRIGSPNAEHLDFIREKQNGICELESTRNGLQTTTDSLQEEIPNLQRELSALTSESASVDKSVQRAISKRRQLEQEVELVRSQMGESDGQIRAFERAARDADAARGVLKTRIESIEAQTDDSAGLPSTIHNLEIEIRQIEIAIEQLEEEINGFAAKEKSMKEDTKAPDQQPIWQQGIAENLKDLQAAVERERRELAEELDNLKRLETRYRRLEPIAGRWAAKLRKGGDRFDEILSPVDQLLKSLENDFASKVEMAIKGQRAELEQLTTANAQCQADIVKKREELERRIVLANTEQARVKDQIKNQRAECSTREEKIVAEIRRLKLKLAQKKFQ
jgi:chromosome segregation ATPase